MNHHTMACKWCEHAAWARHLSKQTSPLSAFRQTAPPRSIRFCCPCHQSYRRLLCSKLRTSYFHEYKLMLWDAIGRRFTSCISASVLQSKPAIARQPQSTYIASVEEIQWTRFTVHPSCREMHFYIYLTVNFCMVHRETLTRPFSTACARGRSQQRSSSSSPSWSPTTPNLCPSSVFSVYLWGCKWEHKVWWVAGMLEDIFGFYKYQSLASSPFNDITLVFWHCLSKKNGQN